VGTTCCATLAGCGKAIDAPSGDAERACLCGRPVDWLRADLAWWTNVAEVGNPQAAALAAGKGALSHWQEDADLPASATPTR
jgi:hypothetical protein